MRKSIGFLDYREQAAKYDGLSSELLRLSKAKFSLPVNNKAIKEAADVYFCEPASIFKRKQRAPSVTDDVTHHSSFHRQSQHKHNFEALKAVRKEIQRSETKSRILKNQSTCKSDSAKALDLEAAPPVGRLVTDPLLKPLTMLPKKHAV